LTGAEVTLRPVTADDVPQLARIRATSEVRQWWRGGDDLVAEITADLTGPEVVLFAIELAGRGVGGIEYHDETAPAYRPAGTDICLDPTVHSRGIGPDAVRTLARYLIVDCGHHRLTIDPAADNTAAIRAYEKVGFRPVGRMRQYERGADGSWHDG